MKQGEQHVIDGQVLDVKHAFKRSNEAGGLPPVRQTKKPFIPKEVFSSIGNGLSSKGVGAKIFVGGISQELTSNDISDYFSKFGAIEQCHLLPDKSNGRHRGFGFISYIEETHADLACANQYQTIKGEKVEVKKALPKNQNYSNQNSNVLAAAASSINLPVISNLPFISVWPTTMPLGMTNMNHPAVTTSSALSSSSRQRFCPYPSPYAHAGSSGLPTTQAIDYGGLYSLQALWQAARSCSLLPVAYLPNYSLTGTTKPPSN